MDQPDRYGWLIPVQAAQPFRSRLAGVVLVAFAPIVGLLFAAAVVGIVYLTFSSSGGDMRWLVFALVLLIFGLLGAYGCYTVGLRLQQTDTLHILQRDHRRPVVFLRSFFEDRRAMPSRPIVGEIRRRPDRGVSFIEGMVRTRAQGHEAPLAEAVRSLGPLVAIGKPGERLALVGAARLYVGDNQWQHVVARLLAGASAAILIPEGTPGTWWELSHVAANFELQRLLLVVPNPASRPLGYERIRTLTAQVLPTALPADPGPCDAFMFDRRGAPRPLRFGGRVREAIEPFIQQVMALDSEPGAVLEI